MSKTIQNVQVSSCKGFRSPVLKILSLLSMSLMCVVFSSGNGVSVKFQASIITTISCYLFSPLSSSLEFFLDTIKRTFRIFFSVLLRLKDSTKVIQKIVISKFLIRLYSISCKLKILVIA